MSLFFVRRLALLALAICGLSSVTLSQAAPTAAARGRITGRVLDPQGAGMSDVGIQVVGTTLGALSGVDGRFTLPAVPAGTVTLLARRIGYGSKTITGITVVAGKTVEQNIAMTPAALQLAATTVTATQERGSVSAALDRQRKATGIVSAITSEQIAKSPDGDAAQAVQRVSGVTVQDGKSVFVRGLGERYTTTSLNGARLPSPEPEKRYVPLDIFPAGLLQTITTTKTFTPDRNGDFGGAEIDIQTREFPVKRAIAFSSTAGLNGSATGQTLASAPRGTSTEWFGFADAARSLPAALSSASALGRLTTQSQVNQAISSLRQVYTPRSTSGLPNGSASFSVGGQDPVLGQRIGYLLTANYAASQEVRDGEVERNPVLTNGRIEQNEGWRGTSATVGTLWGGLFNLSTLIGSKSRIMLNNTYTRSSDNTARQSTGPTFAYSGAVVERTTLRFVAREIRSNQLKGEHAFGRHQVDWSVTSSGVRRDEPDRTDAIRIQFSGAGALLFPEDDPEGLRKTFGKLSESNLTYGANYRLEVGSSSSPFLIRLGALRRTTDRDATNRQFNLRLRTGALSTGARAGTIETLLQPSNLTATSNVWQLGNVAEDGQYTASETLQAGYLMGEWPVTDRIRLIGGARVEQAKINVATLLSNGSTLPAALNNTDVLPSLVLNYRVSETHTLRFSASQTLARPEYRELSPVQFLDVIGSATTAGNPNLRRSLIQNFDTKWEWYPSGGEVISLGAFYKRFDSPIERIDVATGGTSQVINFANAKSAKNLGVEAEVRSNLGSLVEVLRPLTVFGNLTLMSSSIDIGTGVSANTNSVRPMMGQAPYVANAGVTWANLSGDRSATVLYSVVGRRIAAAGSNPYPDLYEQPRNLVDLSLRYPVLRTLSLRVDARNLLDAKYRFDQGGFTRQEWRSGRQFSFGLQLRN
jgi:outer membrane receptor protein involved in Fe transport